MVLKAPSRLSDLLRLACTSSRRHTWRRMHQAVVRLPSSQPAPVVGLSSEHLHAIYQDLMALETTAMQPGADLQVEAPNETVDSLLADHAKRGNIQAFESVMSDTLSAPPTRHQRDLHVKAHIVNASRSTRSASTSMVQQFPTGALAVLHQYEASGHFAPVKSYTRVISALFNVQTCPSSDSRLGRAAAQAQAWDLFAHMRYVAHPVPDAHLYALMIRACGSFSRPEPERALDLWMEMHENDVKPTKGAYEAVIRVCGRAGPEWIGEGMRLAREMSDQYSISGSNGRGLWCALLEGCKRAGDLKKARWILAEAVRDPDNGTSSENSMVDAELMTHMFHAYASYKTPFRRETTRLIDRTAASNEDATEAQKQETKGHDDPPSSEEHWDGDVFPIENIERVTSFSRLPPQTSSDVIAETRALFDRILQDRPLSPEEARNIPHDSPLAGRFAHVELTPMLLNAYLSVFYGHASIDTSQEIFDTLFRECHSSSGQILHADEHTYIDALERCAIAGAEERHVAARWAEDIWRRWEVAEKQGLKNGKGDVGSFARLIERAHTAMRRVLVLSGDIDNALALVRTFVSRYPPSAVLRPADVHASLDTSPVPIPIKSPSKTRTVQLFAKPHILSTRTVLTNSTPSTSSTARPLVRLTPAVSPKDDRVPPIIAFGDIELLHARLAEHRRIKDLGYIKWVCMAYANAVKKRREAVLAVTPTTR